MNAQQYFKEMFHSIWQGHNLSKLEEFYAKDFQETISMADDHKRPFELKMNYDDLVAQAKWYKENYKETTLDIKQLVAGERNTFSVYFYSSSVEKESGELRHRWVCGIWRLNKENKIDRVWAVVTPYYPS